MNEDRLIRLSDALASAADARHMATSSVWAGAWEEFERELLRRLLQCEPEDDVVRYRLQVAFDAARHVRRAIENKGASVESLQKELDLIEGRKPRAVA